MPLDLHYIAIAHITKLDTDRQQSVIGSFDEV